MTSPSLHEKLEAILATLAELTRVREVSEVARLIARGFVDIGAVMAVMLVADGELLRVVARYPESTADELFSRLRGGAFSDFTIPLSRTDNNYVRVLTSREPLWLETPPDVAAHIVDTYDLDPSLKPAVLRTLSGAAGAVFPMLSEDDTAAGVIGVNYRDDLGEADRHLFTIFARSAASLLRFKREVVSREAILAELERALANERETRAELNRNERLAALGEMSAVVAHEIRNPVAIIKNSAAALRKTIPDHGRERMLCDIIDEETGSIERIIDDMLAFSQPLERGARHVRAEELVDRAIYLLGESAHRASIGLDVRCSAAVAADARRVSHALLNLLVNARQATRDRGNVSVQIREVDHAGKAFVRIDVMDTGCGIPAHVQADVFEPFVTTKSSGTGLGLSIVKRIVDAHGGRVSIASEEGEGTTVSVDLPVAERDSPESSA